MGPRGSCGSQAWRKPNSSHNTAGSATWARTLEQRIPSDVKQANHVTETQETVSHKILFKTGNMAKKKKVYVVYFINKYINTLDR